MNETGVKAVKERPILMSGPMVRAILEGMKTQTRRVVKPQPPCDCEYGINGAESHAVCSWVKNPSVWVPPKATSRDHRLPCPYGKPGDRLWVRETWGVYDGDGMPYDYPHGIPLSLPDGFHVSYPADDADGVIREVFRWRPSIHMPRWASRILLEVVSVKVEKVQHATLGDICKEGLARNIYDFKPVTAGLKVWENLWVEINGQKSWDENPYVWVVEFKVLKTDSA